MDIWILTFFDKAKAMPCIGICIVKVEDFLSAVHKSHQEGCNPGGEVLGEIAMHGYVPPSEFMNVLIDEDMAERLDAIMDPIMEKALH